MWMAAPFDIERMREQADGGAVRARPLAGLDVAATWSRVGLPIVGWALPFALVVYLALKGGAYDDVIRGQTGIAISWVLLLGALVGILPVARIGRSGWVALGLLGAFAAWTALGITWSDSAGRSVAELGRVALFVAVFGLALAAQGREGVRRTVGGVTTAIGVVAVLALLSRLHPSWFPPNDTATFLSSEASRLNYPLNYWNGLAAFMAIGLPAMLAFASRARWIGTRAVAAAAVPAMVLVAYYTFSRGGALEIAVGVVVLLALHPRRLSLLPTLLLSAAGSALLIAATRQRDALDHALNNSAAHSQGNDMLAVVLVVCAGVGLIQAAIALAAKYEIGPRVRIPRRAGATAVAAAAIVAVIVAVAAGAPGKLSDDWQQFKNPNGVTTGANGERFISSSGNGRYQYWQSAVDANSTDPLIGIGPGTWEYWWAENGSIPGFVVNAHSLYFETLGEVGIVGLVLLGGSLIWILAVGVRRSLTASRDRTLLAGATAGAAAFAVAAGVDWVWQIAVIPIAFLLLAAAILGSRARSRTRDVPERKLAPRIVLGAMAAAALIVIAIPLAGVDAVRSSQSEVRSGNLDAALADARTARDVQPYSATASLQEALVLELKGDLSGAVAAAKDATSQSSNDWHNWLVLSRLEAERGDSSAAIADYMKAKSLNPRSALFSQ
jgi:hypothetical protein